MSSYAENDNGRAFSGETDAATADVGGADAGGGLSTCVMRGPRRGSQDDPAFVGACALFTEAELFDQPAIAVGVARLQIIEQLAAARHHPQKTAARMVILDVILEMVGKTVDARGQERDLDFSRPGVAL